MDFSDDTIAENRSGRFEESVGGNRQQGHTNENAKTGGDTVPQQPILADAPPADPAAQPDLHDSVGDPSVIPPSSPAVPEPTRVQPTRASKFQGDWKERLSSRSATVTANMAALVVKESETDEREDVFVIPNTYEDAIASKEAEHWIQAMAEELGSIETSNTWTLVDPPPGANIIRTKWVYVVKTDEQGMITRYKARLVAKGYTQVVGVDYQETYASVVKMSTIRVALSLAAINNLEMVQADAVSAFLNSKLVEPIYVEQPQGYGDLSKQHLVFMLNKALYGLKQSAYEWKKTLDEALHDIGFVMTTGDDCLYIRPIDKAMLLVYVDDMVAIVPSVAIANQIFAELGKRFQLKIIGEPKKFLGLEIERDRRKKTITLRQAVYASTILNRFGMTDCKSASTPTSTGLELGAEGIERESKVDRYLYQSMIGSIMFLMLGTRPDLAYSVGALSRHSSKPCQIHLSSIKRVLRYIKGTVNAGLVMAGSDAELAAFSDAAFGDDQITGRSTWVISSCLETESSHGHQSVNRSSRNRPLKLNTWEQVKLHEKYCGCADCWTS